MRNRNLRPVASSTFACTVAAAALIVTGCVSTTSTMTETGSSGEIAMEIDDPRGEYAWQIDSNDDEAGYEASLRAESGESEFMERVSVSADGAERTVVAEGPEAEAAWSIDRDGDEYEREVDVEYGEKSAEESVYGESGDYDYELDVETADSEVEYSEEYEADDDEYERDMELETAEVEFDADDEYEAGESDLDRELELADAEFEDEFEGEPGEWEREIEAEGEDDSEIDVYAEADADGLEIDANREDLPIDVTQVPNRTADTSDRPVVTSFRVIEVDMDANLAEACSLPTSSTYFDEKSNTELGAVQQHRLERVAECLTEGRMDHMDVEVVGFTTETAQSQSHEDVIAKNRAAAVANFLKAEGVEAARIDVTAADGTDGDDENSILDRRVTIKLDS